jgi:hypothetical protein
LAGLVAVASRVFGLLNPSARVDFLVVATCVVLLGTAIVYDLVRGRHGPGGTRIR